MPITKTLSSIQIENTTKSSTTKNRLHKPIPIKRAKTILDIQSSTIITRKQLSVKILQDTPSASMNMKTLGTL